MIKIKRIHDVNSGAKWAQMIGESRIRSKVSFLIFQVIKVSCQPCLSGRGHMTPVTPRGPNPGLYVEY